MDKNYKLIREKDIKLPTRDEVNQQMDFDQVYMGYRDHGIASELSGMKIGHSGLTYFIISLIITGGLIGLSNWGYDASEVKEDVKIDYVHGYSNLHFHAIAGNPEPVILKPLSQYPLEEEDSQNGDNTAAILTPEQPDDDTVPIIEPADIDYEYIKARPVIGFDSLNSFVGNQVAYPEEEIMENTQGTVLVEFEITPMGRAEGIKILHGLSSNIDAEVLRVMNLMPEWEPATLNGAPVSSLMRLPVTFRLDESDVLDFRFIKAEPVIGFRALYKLLQSQLKYPAKMLEDSIGGIVMVQFDITTRGFIENVKIVDKTHNEFEKEAIKVIRRMPYWRPAYLNGRPINSTSILPISFRLKE